MTFPKRVDFTEWLWRRAGIMVPEAVIVIHSAQWDDSGRHEGKPDTQWPERVEYRLCDNATEDKSTFVAMLYNAMAPADLQRIETTPKIGFKQRIYNWLSFAEQEQMEPHHYPYLRRQNRERNCNGQVCL